MTRLLPANFDADLALVEEVFESRLADIDLATLLIYVLDGGPEAALGELGWQFKAIDELWNSATPEQRVEYLRSIIARRRRKGTIGAVEHALAAIGYPPTKIHMRSRPKLYATGGLYADGTFYASPGSKFLWWFVVAGEFLSEADQVRCVAAFKKWRRRSCWLVAWYSVPSAAEFTDVTAYSKQEGVL